MHIGNIEKKMLVLNRIKTNKHSLVYGKQGVGKTSFIHLLGKKLAISEINASQLDSNSTLLRDMQTRSFDNKKRLLFLDEIDGLRFQKSDGDSTDKMTKFIVSLLDQDKFPVVLAANNIGKISKKILEHENIALIHFEKPSITELRELLEKKTNDKEKIEKAIKLFSGDVRQAISMAKGSEGYDEQKIYSTLSLSKLIFTSNNRQMLYNFLSDAEYFGDNSLFTILCYLGYNYFNFYERMNDIIDVSEVLCVADKILYKCHTNKYVDSILSFCIKNSTVSTKLRYPVFKNKKPYKRNKNKK